MKQIQNKYLVIGLMLFAMFFGASNLTYPAFLGIYSGSNLWLAILGFCLSAVTLPLLAVIAIAYSGNDNAQDMIEQRVSKWFAVSFMVVLNLTIGPLFSISRTGAVSFSVGIAPFFGTGLVSKLIYGLIFFGLTYLIAVKPSKIADNIGKYLTPALLLVIATLVLGSFISPAAVPATRSYNAASDLSNAFADLPFIAGLLQGYGTLDALAAFMFITVVINSAKQFGAKSKHDIAGVSLKAGLITTACLAIIYLFVARLGSMSQGLFPMTDGLFTLNGVGIDGGTVLSIAARNYFGTFGQVTLSLAVFLACLSTSSGLVVASADYFHTLLPKLSHTSWSAIMTLIGTFLYFSGLSGIIKASLAMLFFLYPLAIALIVLTLSGKWFKESKTVYRTTLIFTAIAALYDSLATLAGQLNLEFIPSGIANFFTKVVPLGQFQLGWICFAFLGFVIGLMLDKRKS
ncbi:branched-chain amino acid transport system II carrier protein [Streptococcus cuniculipharyngis]|uniref:Branched-chain amino acid transport system carrier protein n=1 Tax=Streptococcus cuniculipharyngis TaxID=1562651 RepID=A0A5C5SBA6_9STRE|nr:branched-chain amino acid transport system II carrier protein [Streptococcus cuniculipharyngis]TWS98167.1 branched-chain amino acid transport system II carrier protein [Streptococcus cuniculipharyngis]